MVDVQVNTDDKTSYSIIQVWLQPKDRREDGIMDINRDKINIDTIIQPASTGIQVKVVLIA